MLERSRLARGRWSIRWRVEGLIVGHGRTSYPVERSSDVSCRQPFRMPAVGHECALQQEKPRAEGRGALDPRLFSEAGRVDDGRYIFLRVRVVARFDQLSRRPAVEIAFSRDLERGLMTRKSRQQSATAKSAFSAAIQANFTAGTSQRRPPRS